MWLFDVQRDFDRACKIMLDHNRQLNIEWNFIKDHERYPLTVRKLCNEVLIFEARQRMDRKKNSPPHILRHKRYQLIAAHAQLFVKLAIQNRDDTVKSDADKKLEDIRSKSIKEVRDMKILKEFNPLTKELEDV